MGFEVWSGICLCIYLISVFVAFCATPIYGILWGFDVPEDDYDFIANPKVKRLILLPVVNSIFVIWVVVLSTYIILAFLLKHAWFCVRDGFKYMKSFFVNTDFRSEVGARMKSFWKGVGEQIKFFGKIFTQPFKNN